MRDERIEKLALSYGVDISYVRRLAAVNGYNMIAVVDKLNKLEPNDSAIILRTKAWDEYLNNCNGRLR
jgi:hypothetical protein